MTGHIVSAHQFRDIWRGTGYPVAESTKQCLRAYRKFTSDYPEYDVEVKLCAFTATEMKEAEQEYEAFRHEN